MFVKATAGLRWYVAHTRPQREKKLATFCKQAGIHVTLPCLKSVKRYGGRRREFEKPLFPSYIFFLGEHEHRQKVRQNDHVANVLDVFDQTEFEKQIEDILRAIESGYVSGEVIGIRAGDEVRILRGPLSGMFAVVTNISGFTKVILRLDFIGQGAAVTVDSVDLEFIAR